MIEIKQEQEGKIVIKDFSYGITIEQDGEWILVEPSFLPHLISRLIELGGVEVDPSTLLCDEDSRSMIQLIQNNYHLIPKADKK